jgi:fatty acid desaturase
MFPNQAYLTYIFQLTEGIFIIRQSKNFGFKFFFFPTREMIKVEQSIKLFHYNLIRKYTNKANSALYVYLLPLLNCWMKINWILQIWDLVHMLNHSSKSVTRKGIKDVRSDRVKKIKF